MKIESKKMKLRKFDHGPWVATGGNVYSDDFTHDVMLRVTGDFVTPQQKQEYAEALAEALNNASYESNN